MKREFLQNLQAEAPLSKETIDAIMAENGRDIEAHRQSARDWEDKYHKAVADHTQQLRRVEFTGELSRQIQGLGGRNEKAISALLDLESLQGQEEPREAIATALQKLKAENDYLFSVPTPPPYASGTGTGRAQEENQPVNLAGALRQRMKSQKG